MWGLARIVWRYRSEIVLAVQFLAAVRKTAKEATEEYIRRRLQAKLKSQILTIVVEIALLCGSLWLCHTYPALWSSLIASTLLWAITLFNLFELLFRTIPEIRAVYRSLKGKVGFTMKYILEVSLVTELMQFNLIFLIVCIVLGVSTRTYVGAHFSYVKPWKQLATGQSTKTKNRR